MSSCIGKKGFESEVDADNALQLIRGSAEAWLMSKVPIRYYLCDICSRYHLTAMSEDDMELAMRKRRKKKR